MKLAALILSLPRGYGPVRPHISAHGSRVVKKRLRERLAVLGCGLWQVGQTATVTGEYGPVAVHIV